MIRVSGYTLMVVLCAACSTDGPRSTTEPDKTVFVRQSDKTLVTDLEEEGTTETARDRLILKLEKVDQAYGENRKDDLVQLMSQFEMDAKAYASTQASNPKVKTALAAIHDAVTSMTAAVEKGEGDGQLVLDYLRVYVAQLP